MERDLELAGERRKKVRPDLSLSFHVAISRRNSGLAQARICGGRKGTIRPSRSGRPRTAIGSRFALAAEDRAEMTDYPSELGIYDEEPERLEPWLRLLEEFIDAQFPAGQE
jgi:hypothetical protein